MYAVLAKKKCNILQKFFSLHHTIERTLGLLLSAVITLSAVKLTLCGFKWVFVSISGGSVREICHLPVCEERPKYSTDRSKRCTLSSGRLKEHFVSSW